MTIGWLALLGVAVALLAYWYWQRWNTLRLNWPGTLGLHRMGRNVDLYLRSQGWIVDRPLLAVHIKMASRGTQKIHLICLPSHVQYDGSKLKDLSREVIMRKPHPVVCVTTSQASPHAMATAAAGQMVLLHYKDLAIFAPGERDTLRDLEAIRLAHLEIVRK